VFFDRALIHQGTACDRGDLEMGYAANCNGLQYPQSITKEQGKCDGDWWIGGDIELDSDYDDGEEEVTQGCYQTIMQEEQEASTANLSRKGIFSQGQTVNEVQMDTTFIISEEDAGALNGDIGTDQVQEDLDEKRTAPVIVEASDTAKRAMEILQKPEYAEQWRQLPNKERFTKHIMTLKDGQIGSERFTEKLVAKWLEKPSVYDTDPDHLTSTNVIKLTAKLAGLDMSKPVNEPARAIPPAMMADVEEMVGQYMKMGILEHDFGPWNTQSIFILKKDGTKRWCQDLRPVNKLIHTITYPQGTVIQAVSTAAGHRVYTTVDALSAFHQIEAAECIRPALAFTIGNVKYRWTRHPFGLSTGVQLFTHCFQLALGDLKTAEGYNKYLGGVVSRVDDVTLYSSHKSHGDDIDHEKIHFELYEEFHNRMADANIQLKLKKCEFFTDHSDMLGWVCNYNGFKGDCKKIEIIKNLPDRLTDQKQIQRLVGSLVYYRLMHKAAADEIEPLTRLLGKGKVFTWGPEQETAVRRAKEILTSPSVMKAPDFSPGAGRFALGVDASGVGYGAVLCQEEVQADGAVIERPIAYISRTLNAAERTRSATERELAAIDWALAQFSGYLLGAPTFRCWSDCRPLEASWFTCRTTTSLLSTGRRQK